MGYPRPRSLHLQQSPDPDRGGQERLGLESTTRLLTNPRLPEGAAVTRWSSTPIATVPFRLSWTTGAGRSNATQGESAMEEAHPAVEQAEINGTQRTGIYEPEPGGISTSLRPRTPLGPSRGLPIHQHQPRGPTMADRICQFSQKGWFLCVLSRSVMSDFL